MHPILKRLNRFSILRESNGGPSWKDPYSPDYDRQLAEDALYHTIGPLTDNPMWVDTDWHAKLSGNDPVPEFKPNSPAPPWTPEEIVFAMAGDPSMFGRASGNPKSPGYGPAGGSPLYRLAKKLAGIYNRERDKGFAEELYMNGLLELTKKMQPGFDEHRSAFIPFVMRSIESAMGHGTGGGREESRAGGESSEYFVNPEGQIRDRLPAGAKKPPEGWRRVEVTGVKQILKMKDPKALRQAADIVQGEYRTKRAYDKHPGNPFGPFSPAYYQKVNQYADAIESKNRDKIEAAQSQLRQLLDEIEDASIQIRGASSGIGSAISTLDRSQDPKKTATKALDRLEDGQSTTLFDITVRKVGEDQFEYPWLDARGKEHKSILTRDEVVEALASKRDLGLQSMDVQSRDDEGTSAGNIEDRPEAQTVDPESLEYVLEICMLYDIGDILSSSKKYNKMAFDLGAKAKKTDPSKANIGGQMTPQELRFIIRRFGNIGQHYPGKGTVRHNLDIPRDGKKGSRNWLEPGEDPEIEPLPTVSEAALMKWDFDGGTTKGGLWHSWWSSNGYPELGPQEIADEMTIEAKRFLKLGIPTARGDRVKKGQPALSKVAAGNTAKSAKIKLEIISDIHSDQVRDTVDESILRRIPLVESARSLDPIDREAIVKTCGAIIKKLDESIAILEKSPPGWKGSVKAMKKHKDIDNPFALAWSMKKKGAKPHYQDKEGTPKKKKKYANEGMQPIDGLDLNE